MASDTAAGRLASHLPGDYQENLAEVVRLRGRRVLKLRAAGLNAKSIEEATGWTYRQQLWAVKAVARGA